MAKPLISVIIPIYNTAAHLEKSIGSVMAQDYDNLEIILIDDGSTDNSLEICNRLALIDKRIVVISKSNGGVSSARNCGLDSAHGEYIGFVDSDDYTDSDMYSFLLANAQKYNADISQCGYHENKYNRFIKNTLYDSCSALKSLISYSDVTPCLWNKLYSAKLFEDIRFDQNYSVAEDLLCNYRLIKKIKKMVISSDKKYHYTFRQDSCMNGELSEKHFLSLVFFDHILSNEYDTDILSCCKIGKVKASLDLIRRIFYSNTFTDRYPDLRRNIINEKKTILFNRKHELKLKLKIQVLLIWFAPWLYKILFILKHRINKS